jgi:transcriptional regulator with XRE-family HTH domain
MLLIVCRLKSIICTIWPHEKNGTDIRTILAENIREYRRGKNLSQEELADKCGLHRTHIGSVERCERNVTLSTLEVLASALGVSIPELLSKKEIAETGKPLSR